MPQEKATQVWKAEKIQRGDRNAGGIDWICYRQTILYPLLYPFLMKIRQENPTPEIWLVEDNASAHTAAVKHDPLTPEPREAHIFIPRPSGSECYSSGENDLRTMGSIAVM